MAFPRRSSRTPRSRFTLGLLLLTAVTLLVLDLPGTGPLDPVRSAVGAVFRPIRSAGDVVFRPISNGWKGAFNYGDVKDERDRLRERLAKVKSQEARVRQLEREVAAERKLNKVVVKDAPTKSAAVTSAPLNNFDHTIEIDQGSSDGVHKGMVVVAGGTAKTSAGAALLGRIVHTSSGSATVELMYEPSFAVGIRLPDQGLATAQGRGEGKSLIADGVDEKSTIKRGDVVTTSGLTRSAFPKDLVVGRVTKVSESSSGNSKTIEIRPAVDFNSVYVRVVLLEAG